MSTSEPLPVTVYVLTPPAADTKHPYYLAQYVCPNSGRRVTQSTKIPKGSKSGKKKAEKFAATWESQLRSGAYAPPSKTTWDVFRDRYETEHVPSLADATARKISGVFNSFEKSANLGHVRDATEGRISNWQASMRKAGLAESTIAGNLAHLRAALAWAVEQKILHAVPKIRKPKRAKGAKGSRMKGRPLTAAEYQRMLTSVEAGLLAAHQTRKRDTPAKRTIGMEAIERMREAERASIAETAPAWQRLIEGLWWSGLRLGEALDLWWDGNQGLVVVVAGDLLRLTIPAENEKGNEDRTLPLAPEFVEFLLRTPPAERTGRVFPVPPRKGSQKRMTTDRVSRLISAIGEAAGVVVNRSGKFASAHDLRRSFGERWAAQVMPTTLTELMRHVSINTTMAYYVGRHAGAVEDVLWAAYKLAGGGANGVQSANGSHQPTAQPTPAS